MRKLRASFKSGKTKPIEFRKQQLQRLCDLLKENKDDLKGALQEDLKKVRKVQLSKVNDKAVVGFNTFEDAQANLVH